MVTEVIRPGAYRLKDGNGDVLTNTWNIEQLRRFSLKNSVLLFFSFNVRSYRAPRPKHFWPGSLEGSTRARYHLFFYYHMVNTFFTRTKG